MSADLRESQGVALAVFPNQGCIGRVRLAIFSRNLALLNGDI
jgi:hypothetical protein